MAVQIQIRRGTAAAWTSANPTLAAGEFAVETDTDKYKFGDGSTAWTSLGYSSLPSTAISNTVVDAKGDIIAATADNTVAKLTVGSNGQVLTAASGQSTGLQWTTISSDSISDADSDTKIQVEEGSDEDIIRFDTAGTERMSIGATGTVTIVGDLTVNGTTTTINSTTLSDDDKNIELGSVASPDDTTADGGGITLKGASDKTITWTNSTDTWDFNQGIKVTGTATATAFSGPIAVADTTDTSCNVALFEDATGNLAPKTDGALTYSAGTGIVTARGATDGLGGFNGPSILTVPANKGSGFTLAASDAGAFVRINTTSANTVTVPPNSAVAYPIGTQIILCVLSTGVTTIAPGSGVALHSVGNSSANAGDLKIDGQYATAALVKTLTDQWHVFGKLTS